MVSALAVSGCSYRLASLVSTDDADSTSTGSIAAPAYSAVQRDRVASGSAPAQVDLAYARAVASSVVGQAGKDASVPWQNPQTGASGNIMPLDTSYSEDGLPCRDFLAELSARHGAGLAPGRRLPHRQRQLGSDPTDAAQAELKRLSSLKAQADSPGIALRGGRLIPTLGRRG